MRLPNFLVIGAARCGTTSLYHALRSHPSIFLPLKKEPQFFTSNFHKGIDHYSSLFSPVNERHLAVGECSNSYSYGIDEGVERRILALLGSELRIIYLVREPVSRTFSHFLYYKNYNQTEHLCFEDAIASNPVYLNTSNYAHWVESYGAVFGHKQLHVETFDDWTQDPASVLTRVLDFLEVPPELLPASAPPRKTNASLQPRNNQLMKLYRWLSATRARRFLESFIPESQKALARNMIHRLISIPANDRPSDETSSQLASYFEPMIERLEGLIQKDLQHWKAEKRPLP